MHLLLNCCCFKLLIIYFDNITDIVMDAIHLPGEDAIMLPPGDVPMPPRDNSSTEKDVHVLFQPPNHNAPPMVIN